MGKSYMWRTFGNQAKKWQSVFQAQETIKDPRECDLGDQRTRADQETPKAKVIFP